MIKDEKTRLYPTGYGCQFPKIYEDGARCQALCYRNTGPTDCGGRTQISKPLAEVPIKLRPPGEVVLTEHTKSTVHDDDQIGEAELAYLRAMGYK